MPLLLQQLAALLQCPHQSALWLSVHLLQAQEYIKNMFVSMPGCVSDEKRSLCQACSIARASKEKIC
jgi:hypothetical protein